MANRVGEQAFPRALAIDEAGCRNHGPEGMTLRDWFAGQALAMGEGVWAGGHLPENAPLVAEKAYALADAMLEARKS